MFNRNDQIQGDLGNTPIVDGTPVYDAAGDKIGDVVEHNDQGGYLTLQKGWLFPKDVYVPMSAIQRTTTDGIYLSMTKDQLQNQNWENPPGFAGDNRDISMSNTTGAADRLADDTGTTGYATDTLAGAGGYRQTGGHSTPVRDDDVAVPVTEEQLTASKQPYEAGRVHVNRDVVEQEQTLNVPVTHEEIRVEHVPVQGDAANVGPEAFTDQDIDVPVMGEQVQAEKRARVNEELHLHKRAVTENQQVSDTVRKERVNVEGVDGQDNLAVDNGTDAGYDDTTQVNRP